MMWYKTSICTLSVDTAHKDEHAKLFPVIVHNARCPFAEMHQNNIDISQRNSEYIVIIIDAKYKFNLQAATSQRIYIRT